MKSRSSTVASLLISLALIPIAPQCIARQADSTYERKPIDITQHQTFNKRQKMSMEQRKLAAQRLKQSYRAEIKERMTRSDGMPVGYDHKGYTGQGKSR